MLGLDDASARRAARAHAQLFGPRELTLSEFDGWDLAALATYYGELEHEFAKVKRRLDRLAVIRLQEGAP